MMTEVPLDRGVVESLEPTEGTDSLRAWISPFDVPRSVEVDAAGQGLVRSIRFLYLSDEATGKGRGAVPLDQPTDPAVDLYFSDPNGRVVVLECKSAADASALGRVADRLAARAKGEARIAPRFSLLMTARVLKVWADRFAGVEGSARPAARPQPEGAKMLVTKMFDQGELVIELVQPYVAGPQTNELTESGRWMALIHRGAVPWFSGGPLFDRATRKTELFETKEAALEAAIDFAKSCGLREI